MRQPFDPCSLAVDYLNGTTNQWALFNAAIDFSNYDFNRISLPVRLDFTPDPSVGMHNEFAYTEIILVGGVPDHANVHIKDDLDDPNRPGDEGGAAVGTYRGDDFFMETVHHELGHVLLGLTTLDQQTRIAAMFGLSMTHWNDPADPWEDRVVEMFAETFKDVFLPRQFRKFNNRTSRRLLRSEYTAFLDLIEEICCPSFGGGIG